MGHDKIFVRDAFASIAHRYDLLNTLLSFGVEIRWRRRAAVLLAPRSGERILDLCAGTLTLSRTLERAAPAEADITAMDFCLKMLSLGASRLGDKGLGGIHPLCGDAEAMPCAGASFDGALVAYGIRNLNEVDRGLQEIHRVLKPGGRLVILDFTRPRRPLISALYGFYLRYVLPAVGGLISGNYRAYRHLADSIQAFMEPEALLSRLEKAGFCETRLEALTLGVAGIFLARKHPGS